MKDFFHAYNATVKARAEFIKDPSNAGLKVIRHFESITQRHYENMIRYLSRLPEDHVLIIELQKMQESLTKQR